MDDLDLISRQKLYFQRYGDPAHIYGGRYQLLVAIFHGSVQWPPRTTDLTNSTFFCGVIQKTQFIFFARDNSRKVASYRLQHPLKTVCAFQKSTQKFWKFLAFIGIKNLIYFFHISKLPYFFALRNKLLWPSRLFWIIFLIHLCIFCPQNAFQVCVTSFKMNSMSYSYWRNWMLILNRTTLNLL